MNDRMNGRRAQGWNRAGGGTAGGRDISAWALGLLCGFGGAAAHEALQLPLGLALALASGLPVAAFPVSGPLDVIGQSGAGALSDDLRLACLAALEIPRERAREHSLRFTWKESARQFLHHIEASRAAGAARVRTA